MFIRKRVTKRKKLLHAFSFLTFSLVLSGLLCAFSTERADKSGNDGIHTIVEKAEWMELYFEIMEDKEEETAHITLIDIDFDKIPELFLSELGTFSTAIYQGYSFKKGDIIPLQIPDELMPVELELYRNKKTNEKIWIASGTVREESSYNYIWSKVDFKDFSDIRESLFYEIVEDKNGNHEVIKEQSAASKAEAFSGYELEDTLSLFSFVSAFKGAEGTHLDRNLFYSFAQLYESTSKENSQIDKTDPMQLPIFSINLFDTFSKESPISVIRKEYERQDDKSRTNIRVYYSQINGFSNLDLQRMMNEKLKKFALSDRHVKTEKDMELTIIQSPTIYRDFLSVKEWVEYYAKDVKYPRRTLLAITLDIKTGEELCLTNIIAVDHKLKEKIFAGDFKNDKFSHEECIQFEIYDTLWKKMQGNGQNNFYLTEHAVGFILELPHKMGDYMTFEIPYKDLKEWLCI